MNRTHAQTSRRGIAARAAPTNGERWLLLYLEVKSTTTPFAHFPPADRRALLELAARAGAEARLFWWPKGVGIERARVFQPSEWPEI